MPRRKNRKHLVCLSKKQADRAVYIDFEGFKDNARQLANRWHWHTFDQRGPGLHLTGRGASDILAGASRLADRLGESGPSDQRAMLRDMVRRIDVQNDLIGICIVRASLHDAAGRAGDNSSETSSADLYRLDIPVRFKRRGVEMKLVLAADPETSSAPDPALIKAIAQGHQWFTQFRDGELQSVRALSLHHGVNQGDISRILPLGLLAPDIMEAILKGRQPAELTASRLKRIRDLPVSWAEQREMLGFS
jgi:site-specific DNA recombinase